MSLREPEAWEESNGFAHRIYKRRKDYLKHQASKLKKFDPADLLAYHEMFRDELAVRLATMDVSGKSVLCLGARSGAEVQAFIRCGAFAIGIDLNPGQKNRYVVLGDFHRIVFAAESVDIVYSNAFDHVFDLAKVLSEIRRVLRPGGSLIVEAIRGYSEGGKPGQYESFAWATLEDLIRKIEDGGFALLRRLQIETPWPGEQLVLEPV